MELQGSQALRQQAELISRQLQELRRLEEEVRVLRENSLQQKMKLETQAMELEALARAEKAGRAEAEGLRAALAGAEVVRKKLEEGSQRELEEVQRLHQEQVNVGVGRPHLHSGDLGSGFPAESRYGKRRHEQWRDEKRALGRGAPWCFGFIQIALVPRTQLTTPHLKPPSPPVGSGLSSYLTLGTR